MSVLGFILWLDLAAKNVLYCMQMLIIVQCLHFISVRG